MIEEVAAADALVAWRLIVAAGSQIITSRLPVKSLKAYYSNGPDTWPKGRRIPEGRRRAGGGRLSALRPMATGERRQGVRMDQPGLFIKDAEGLRKAPNGSPDVRVCLIPRDEVEVIETWDAVGLRGTRSDDLAVKGVFVPENWQASLYGPSKLQAPMLGISMPFATGPHHSAVVTGILKAAVRSLAAASLTRKPAFNPTMLMKDDPTFRTRFGEIAARVDAVCALAGMCVDILETCDRERRDVEPLAEGARPSAAESLVHHEGTRLMDEIMMLSGSAGVYMSNPQQRRWRDLRCVAQHVAANMATSATTPVHSSRRPLAEPKPQPLGPNRPRLSGLAKNLESVPEFGFLG